MDLNRPLDFVVVGGSLAALLTTNTLLQLPTKHKITILERSPVPLLHDQGAGIVAGSETLTWLQRFDPSDRKGDVDKLSVLSRERLYLDQAGEVLDREGMQQRMTSWSLVYDLGRLGLEQVGGGVGDGRVRYEYGRVVRSVEDLGGQVRVKYVKNRDGEHGKGDEESMEADFVIVADGPSSSLRGMLLGEKNLGHRYYAGYVAFRGTVPEDELSPSAKDVFVQRFTFFHGKEPSTQILAYTIPGQDGTVEEGKRLVNWVWYWNFDGSSDEYAELMTDVDGKNHRFTLPTGGKMQKAVWEKQISRANTYLPPQFAEIITKTKLPFVQAITDLEPPQMGTKIGRLLNGKAVIVGDALAGFRPHTAASTSQAAFHALMLERVFKGEIGWEEYEQEVLNFAWGWQKRGVMLGQRSQFGVHPLAGREAKSKQEVERGELWMRK